MIDVFLNLLGLRAGKSLQSRADYQSVSRQKRGIKLVDSASKQGQPQASAAALRRQDMKTTANKSKVTTMSKSAAKAKPAAKKAIVKAQAKPLVKTAAKTASKSAGATKAITKSAAKTSSKSMAKPSVKPSVKAPVKALAKPLSKTKPTTAVKPAAKMPVKKAPVKPSAKPQSKPQPKPVAKAPVKTATKVAVKAAAKPAAKPTPKSSAKSPSPAQKKVPLKSSQKNSVQAAGKPQAKPPIQPVTKLISKPALKPVTLPASQAIAKPAAKSSSKSPAKAAAPANTAPPVASAKPVAPPPAPPKPTKAGARVVPSYSPSAANMSPHGGNTAAKASFTLSAPVLAPPPQIVFKKDAKLANNWKTKTADQLSDAEVSAMPDSEYMNATQLAFFRGKLVALKNGILSNAGETTEHLREDTSVVPDPADRATIEEEHALELRTRDRERKLLKKIEQSILSIDADEYGYCDETGEPIGVPRLIARPTATLSLEAQQRRELKQKMFGD